MRAAKPDSQGEAVRDGGRLHWELYGSGDPTVFLLPTWSIIHSRHWKFQIAYLARHYRVLVMDGRGNGLSDRPTDARAYADKEFVADALSVLDAVGTQRAVVVGFSAGCSWALALAANHPELIIGAVFIGNGLPFASSHAERAKWSLRFNEEVASEDGWAKSNRHYWLRNYPGYVDFFMHQVFPQT